MVSDMLATGGAERCASLLSVFFDKNNCQVHHVVVVDKVEYEYAGELLNLGRINNNSNGFFDRLNRFRVLRNFFSDNEFDYILDFRVKNHQWQEFYIAKFIYKAPLIVTIHSYMIDLYFPKNRLLTNWIYSNCNEIIAVSNGIKKRIDSNTNYLNSKTIYNPIDINYIESVSNETFDFDFKYILAVGRMHDNIKQFDKLIESYANSELPQNDVKLIILGDGILKSELVGLVKTFKLEDMIRFEGQVGNPFKYYKNAFFTILSSKNEGFPMVLIESLACGTPVVSFDCLSGPNEIIINNENGILVENQNFEKLTLSMNKMIQNKEFYLHCKQNAKPSVERFSIEIIGKQWLELFKIK
ncbi:N-acetylgalactosamine-N,N'-diacetylbacillosaminyl-diphospho-undecaprenol 4-alpha-N-acetylgalactosaminyltransferase [Flavobacterium fluvii]|uniref:N-acetylgalactosamine-N,N'-diacetylbacillosaminyl-diphospho-undecaprenol 4-alpha-N-acetylgalactosaminyltransferase n=2 Tax=Flavobacterium fluvii TaxID=468056 RepID=A0A1M5J5E0_9FLAO|nr:N-acetylgalactosamine-N,N'-diacetylbacillosaminyl-diphospho-undecaprenol 4-alpha-N-acetylgalactosaminyltransferase [Flavobacterium fluvii]